MPPYRGHKNILTNLHEDWASNVTSIVFTNCELSRGINGAIVLTKFHEDRTINVASRVFTRQNVDGARRNTDDGQKAITKAHHEHIMLSFGTDRQTDRQKDRQTGRQDKNNKPPIYRSGGIKT
ncbi:hypothetical protein DPMN_024003 [Dreissena polymorpha]|uniref:Uncharacterized protein n=1 Tax=Dreissena polymorpha TaxID=45954 RepID=A0A9D4RCA8_DREPO|nr:hypothetical protein DPMN_024003 [Dreissena polymorpha]